MVFTVSALMVTDGLYKYCFKTTNELVTRVEFYYNKFETKIFLTVHYIAGNSSYVY